MKTGGGCGYVVPRSLHGDARRCTTVVLNQRCKSHSTTQPHTFDLAPADDRGFPKDYDTTRERIDVMEANRQYNRHVAEFAAATNLSARQAGSDAMTQLLQKVATTTMRLAASSPSFRPSSITAGSPTTISDTIRDQGHGDFDDMIEDARDRLCSVTLLTDSGTVLRFNTLHAVLVNPNFPEAVIPFDVQENLDFDAIHYEEFFKKQIADIRDHGIELVAIICDNCPAQLDGVVDSLAFFDNLGITHIPCFNHMVNLVFTHALKHPPVARLLETINDIIADLQTPKGNCRPSMSHDCQDAVDVSCGCPSLFFALS
jgi:hypothetical protein